MARLQINARLTGYWPFKAGLTEEERRMEGGTNDYLGNPLYTLESYQRGEAPYVSVAGDKAVWPYGQLIELDAWPGVVFRIVDTGGHFTGAGKLYREEGREPLDICVDSSSTTVPKRAVATVVEGDKLPGGKLAAIAWNGVKGQTPGTDDSFIENAITDVVEAIEDVVDDADPTVLVSLALLFGGVLYFVLE